MRRMDGFTEAEGFVTDLTDTRLHHEIYLTDARKTDPSKMKTVIRHPVKRKD